MACKESMVTAPVMTALVDAALVFGSISLALRARWRFYLCLAATWGILAALLSTGPRVHSAGLSSGVSPWTYLLNQPDIILDYLKHTVWPTGLVALYGWPVDLTIGQVWLPGLIVVLLLAVTVLAMVKQPRLGLLGAWFFITLAPASSLVPIATEAGAERRMYLPLMAIAVLAVIGLWRTLTARIPGRDRRVWLVVAPLVIALGATTVVRHRDYDSELRLAQTSFDARPNDLARHFLGVALVAEGRRDEGLAMLRQATATNPRAWFDLGRAYYEGKQLDESVAALEEFARRQPDLLEVVDARLLICRVFTHRKEWVRAIEQCREVLRMAPSSGEARQLLGSALTGHGINFVAEGKLAEATDMFRQVVAMDPANPDAHRNLAVVYFDRGEMPQAAQHARLGLELRADDAVMLDVLRQTQLPGSQR
jgi:Flp pilus assembly protein TadD